ncbi:MAG: hypothetical protein AAF694_03575 [Bacteroidota bacterium]
MNSYLYIKSPLLFNPNKLQKEVQDIIQHLISTKELTKGWESINLLEVSFQKDSYLSYVLNFFDAPKESMELKRVVPATKEEESSLHSDASDSVPIYIPINAPGKSICRLNEQNVCMASGECWIIPPSSTFSPLHMPQIHLCITLKPSTWTKGFVSLGERFIQDDLSLPKEEALAPLGKELRPGYFQKFLPWASGTSTLGKL